MVKRVKNKDLLKVVLTNNIENICNICGSNKTHIKVRNGRGSPTWYNYNNGKICQNCYNKFITAPKHRKKFNDKYKDYRLDYCGINLCLSFILPKEICEICSTTRKEQKIHRHHYFYCIIMPWACTISVCNSCHSKITNIGSIKVNSIIRTCLICNKTDNYKKIPHKYENGYICWNCYMKERRRKSKYK